MAKKKVYTKSYFIEMNIQSSPKPASRDWYIRLADKDSVPEFTVEKWEYTLDRKEDSFGIAEGFDPELNFRRAFLPEEGHYWVSRDFSGQELRILANLSGEKVWIKTFLEGGDPHKATAVALWGEENYNKERRRDAKAINFGLVYGKTAGSLANDLGISKDEAQKYMDKFFEKLPNIKRYLDNCARQASKNHEISNIYGRKRRLKSYINQWGQLESFGERKSFNFPIQSMGAEIIKLALIRFYKQVLMNEKYKDKGLIYFMLTIHDQIDASIDKSIIKEAAYEMGQAMEHKMKGYPVPIVTGLELGHSMGLTWAFEQDPETLELTPVYEPLEEEKND